MKSLHGKWQIDGREGIVWEFIEGWRHTTSSGDTVSGGRLRQWNGNSLQMQADYQYLEPWLALDRTNTSFFGRLMRNCKEMHRVERADEHTLRLTER